MLYSFIFTLPILALAAKKRQNSNGCSLYTAVDGDTCISISAAASIGLDDFFTFNPTIPGTCDDLSIGETLCISSGSQDTASTASPTSQVTITASVSSVTDVLTSLTPTPTDISVIPSASASSGDGECEIYTVMSGDTCNSIATLANIGINDFFTYNPLIPTNCSDLVVNEIVCLSPTTNSTPAAIVGIITAPISAGISEAPTPSNGSVKGYTTQYTVVENDNCNSIGAQFNFDFYSLNGLLAAADPGCLTLAVGQQVTVPNYN